jgi:hypothetical protein
VYDVFDACARINDFMLYLKQCSFYYEILISSHLMLMTMFATSCLRASSVLVSHVSIIS